ncbi:MAG: 1-aminocyclopropane-1-carboxylate deaminase/D-cysteine desulfhydrase [Thermocrispum sp.]
MPALHERFDELIRALPHRKLGGRPTPVRPLPGVSAGKADVWVKDEGSFGDGGWGGNKVRKLEWLLPDAVRRGHRTVLTFGGLGTNWGLATARYGRDAGLNVALALLDQPVDDHVRAQLGRLESSGATIHRTGTKARTLARLPWLLARHADGVRPPYLLPPGGSSAVGVLGYVETALELAGQIRSGELPEPSHVVLAVGTGGTAAGLLLGLRLAGLETKVVGVVVNDALRLDAHTVLRLARRTERVLRERGARMTELALTAADVDLPRDWLGPGYGHATPDGARATEQAAAAGLRLDPVYTAKAMAGLQAIDEAGHFGGRPVLFVHTDGPR